MLCKGNTNHTIRPVNRIPYKMFLKYLYATYFNESSVFNYRLWNHHHQLLRFNDPDCTTNSCESVNSGLNRNCPTLRTDDSICIKIMNHKKKHRNQYIWKVKNNNLSGTKRPKWRTEKFEILQDLCENYDKFSGPERKKISLNTLDDFLDEMPSQKSIMKPQKPTMRLMMRP